MLDIEADTFAFIRERLTESAGEVRASLRDDDPAGREARAKVLDAAAGVLSALQTLLRATEEMVLHRRDRLVGDGASQVPRPAPERTSVIPRLKPRNPSASPTDGHRGPERPWTLPVGRELRQNLGRMLDRAGCWHDRAGSPRAHDALTYHQYAIALRNYIYDIDWDQPKWRAVAADGRHQATRTAPTGSTSAHGRQRRSAEISARTSSPYAAAGCSRSALGIADANGARRQERRSPTDQRTLDVVPAPRVRQYDDGIS